MTELLKRMADEATSKLQGLERQLCAHHNALAFHHLEACQALLDADPRFSDLELPKEKWVSPSGAVSVDGSAAGVLLAAHVHEHAWSLGTLPCLGRSADCVAHGHSQQTGACRHDGQAMTFCKMHSCLCRARIGILQPHLCQLNTERQFMHAAP